jgi:hypothetical protein
MRSAGAAFALLCLALPPLTAQTADWGRTTIGLSVGLRTSSSLWVVPNQPILSSNLDHGVPYPPDLFHLNRSIRGSLSLAAQATFYSSWRLGWTVEVAYLGMQLHDICTVAHDGGDAELATACAFVGSDQKFGQGVNPTTGYHDAKGTNHSASATLLHAGVVVRPFEPRALQPFVKLLVGLAETPKSTVHLESTYGEHADTALAIVIYQDYSWKPARPVITAAAGLTSAPSHGLQLHFEVRESFLTESIVTGPSTAQNQVPPNHSEFRGALNVLLGLELALKHGRGKRY